MKIRPLNHMSVWTRFHWRNSPGLNSHHLKMLGPSLLSLLITSMLCIICKVTSYYNHHDTLCVHELIECGVKLVHLIGSWDNMITLSTGWIVFCVRFVLKQTPHESLISKHFKNFCCHVSVPIDLFNWIPIQPSPYWVYNTLPSIYFFIFLTRWYFSYIHSVSFLLTMSFICLIFIVLFISFCSGGIDSHVFFSLWRGWTTCYFHIALGTQKHLSLLSVQIWS